MSITEIINDMTEEMVETDGFERYMNKPETGDNQAYLQKDYKTSELWVCCPYCSKKNLKVKYNTSIKNLEFKCKGSKCKKIFFVNIKDGKEIE